MLIIMKLASSINPPILVAFRRPGLAGSGLKQSTVSLPPEGMS
jgi:hypothetical protein